MPIFMDVHIVPGVKARDVAEAHRKDLFHEDEFGCKCMTYWIDEERENIFCLIEAPTKEAVEEMHSRAHGLVPHKVIEVSSSLVDSFLGRIYDPADAQIIDGMKVFKETSLRVLMVTIINDPVLLQHQYGAEKTTEWLQQCNTIIRKHIAGYDGREVEQGGDSFIISFTSAAKAVSCAITILEEFKSNNLDTLGLKIGINSGEPVENSDSLFGDTIHLAGCMCDIAKNMQLAISSNVKELVAKDHQLNGRKNLLTLAPQDESFLQLLFSKLNESWQDPDFDIDDYSRAMAVSKSQLYRKTISLTGLSPNQLLKEFRLEKAKDLMKKQRHNISQITFETGFSSPSYFTKCFKKKYNLLPMAYLDLLH